MFKISNPVLVDNREDKHVFEILDQFNIKYEKKQLPVGDYVYGQVVVERKTIEDFVGSVYNGHLKTQIAKMIDNYKKSFVLVSGTPRGLLDDSHINPILGFVGSIVGRYNIPIIFLDNDYDLLYCAMKIFEKHENYKPLEPVVRKPSIKDVRIGQVACIPGVGKEKATRIIKKYKTIYNLIVWEKDLETIEGIGPKIAKNIRKYLGIK